MWIKNDIVGDTLVLTPLGVQAECPYRALSKPPAMLVVMTGHLKSDFDVSLDGLFERVFLNVDKATNFTYNDQKFCDVLPEYCTT